MTFNALKGWMMCLLRLFILCIVCLPVAAPAGDNVSWPCFHGPRRDNLSTDTGLMQTWPEEGPTLLWTASDIGFGYSSVVVLNDRIFTAGMIDKQTYVTALNILETIPMEKMNNPPVLERAAMSGRPASAVAGMRIHSSFLD